MPFVLKLLLVVLSLQIATVNARTPRVVGGEASVENAWPWVVSIHFARNVHECGGSLIAPTWVLTAGHCVMGNHFTEVAENITVYAGIYKQSALAVGQKVGVKRFIAHPKWITDADSFDDIALLELDQAVTAIEPIKLNASNSLPDFATVLGWGTTRSGQRDFTDALYQVELPLVSNAACQAAYTAFNGVTIYDYEVCAGYINGGKDACAGDSGGPLMIQNGDEIRLIGIVSFGDFPSGIAPGGIYCAGIDSYGVYTRVSAYQDFIQQYIPNIEFSDMTLEAPELGQKLTVSAININDKTLPTASQMWAKLKVCATEKQQNCTILTESITIKSTEYIDLSFNLQLEASDIGQKVDVLMLAVLLLDGNTPLWFIKQDAQNWTTWTGNRAFNLSPYLSKQKLEEKQSLTMFQGFLPYPNADLLLFTAYRFSDLSKLVFNQQAMHIHISD